MSDFFVVNRSMFKSFLWDDKPFTKGQAWIDLFGHANYSDSEMFVRGVAIEIKRGQSGRSELSLARDWGWSRGKVKRFLLCLKIRQMIDLKQDNKTSIITICNYEQYQLNKDFHSTADSTPNEHQTNTKQDTSNKNNKNNKGNKKRRNEKEILSPLKDKEEFIKQIPQNIWCSNSREIVLLNVDKMTDYCLSHGKKYTDYNATLRNFIRSDLKRNPQKFMPNQKDMKPKKREVTSDPFECFGK